MAVFGDESQHDGQLRPVNHTAYRSKWLASIIWIRDVFCSQHLRYPAPKVPTVRTKTRLGPRFCNKEC